MKANAADTIVDAAQTLREIGHGDRIVIADGYLPAEDAAVHAMKRVAGEARVTTPGM